MAEYYVAWTEVDNKHVYQKDKRLEPNWFRVWRVNLEGRDVAISPTLTKTEAHEMLRQIKLLDPPAQKELTL